MKASDFPKLGALRYLVGGRKQKGKEPASGGEGAPGSSWSYGYGSAAHTRPGETLERVEEVEDNAEENGVAMWVHDREHPEEEDDWDEEGTFAKDTYSYRRSVRVFAIVPICSLVVFVLLAVLPSIIWPQTHWHPDHGPPRLFPAFLLSAALWSLSYVLRIPSFKIVSYSLALPSTWLKSVSPSAYSLLDSAVIFVHSALFVVLQEFLRLSAFVIISLHWHEQYVTPSVGRFQPNEERFFAHDAVFREVWFMGLAWAAAEVGAGIAQGYENLMLYDEGALDGGNDGLLNDDDLGNNIKLDSPRRDSSAEDMEDRMGTKSSIDRLLESRPGVLTNSPDLPMDVDAAILQLSNVKAREDLEEVYGMPFIDIPVFVTILQRIDSCILSLALTLLLALAYLPPHPYPESPSLRLWPTFAVTTAVHAFLAILYTPPVLSRIGLAAAAYVVCLIGLALLFGGVGLWVGLWG